MQAAPSCRPTTLAFADPSLGAPLRGVGLLGISLAASLLWACPDPVNSTLRFEPSGSLASAPIPDERYRAGDTFQAAQAATMPFLTQLDRAGVDGPSPTTRIRIPFSPPGDNSLAKIDVSTADPAIRLYDVTGETAKRLPLTEFRLRPTTGAVTCRPAKPLPVGGRFAVVVVANWLRTKGGGTVAPTSGYQTLIAQGDPLTDDALAKVMAVDPDVTSRAATDAFFTFRVSGRHQRARVLRDVVFGNTPAALGDGSVTIAPGLPGGEANTVALAVEGRVVASGAEAVAVAFEEASLAGAPSSSVGRIVVGNLQTPNFLAPLNTGLEDPEWRYHIMEGQDRTAPFDATNPPRLNAELPVRPIPYLLFLPDSQARNPDEPMDVVVALHGFQGRKEQWFAMAESVAARGMALIAIDAYQHGARQRDVAYPEGGDNLLDAAVAAGDLGREFPDPFLNPTFLERTEGKWLQSVVDTLALVRLLSTGQGDAGSALDWDGDGQMDSVGRITFLGTSLGAMIGTTAAAVSPEVERVALYALGGGLSDLARDSQSIGVPLTLLMLTTANLAPFGLLAGLDTVFLIDRPEREVYGVMVDAMLASIDPANHGQALVDGSWRGDGGAQVLIQATEFDLLVPNNATDRVVRAMMAGLPAGSVGVIDTADRPALFELSATPTASLEGLRVRISQFPGVHGVLLDWVDPEATAAAQAEAADFLAEP